MIHRNPNFPGTSGPLPNSVALYGEAYGRTEANRDLPFVGAAGKLQRKFFEVNGIDVDTLFLSNVSQRGYVPGNPTPDQVEIDDSVMLVAEQLEACSPSLIIAAGQVATSFFLGAQGVDDYGLKISQIYGVLHRPGCFMGERERVRFPVLSVLPDHCLVLPILHPSFALRSMNDGNEFNVTRTFWGYERASEYIQQLRDGKVLTCSTDNQFPEPEYKQLVTTDEVTELLWYLAATGLTSWVAIDTEFSVDYNGRIEPVSIQFCWEPGEAYCVVFGGARHKSFALEAVRLIAAWFAKHKPLVILHNANTPQGCYIDVKVCAMVGLDLLHYDIYDTMYQAYLDRAVPQGLKDGGWRKAGVRPVKISEVGMSMSTQLNYLRRLHNLSLPQSEFTLDNGQEYRPQSYSNRAAAFIGKAQVGYYSDPVELYKAWNGPKADKAGEKAFIRRELMEEHELAIGEMPVPSIAQAAIEDLVFYGCQDVDNTLRIFGANTGYDILEIPMIHFLGTEVLKVFYRMQENGMVIDREYFANMKAKMEADIEDAEMELKQHAEALLEREVDVNVNSPVQLVGLLKDLSLDHLAKKLTDSKQISTSKDSIGHLRDTEPVVDAIFRIKEARKVVNTFLKVMLTKADEKDRVHTCLSISTASRRPASNKPNLLNLPSYGNVRRGFPSPGDDWTIVACDYSQIELRILAHLSNDALMKKAFESGADFHTATAEALGMERRPAKVINFGIVYGASDKRVAQEAGISVDEAEKYKRIYFAKHRGVKRFMQETEREVKQYGYVVDMWRMKRYLPIVWSRNRAVVAKAVREAINHKVQGGAQGLMHHAMVWIDAEIEKRGLRDAALWCLEPYDEIVMRIRVDVLEEVRELVIDGMVNHCGVKLRVPVTVDFNTARTWGGCK